MSGSPATGSPDGSGRLATKALDDSSAGRHASRIRAAFFFAACLATTAVSSAAHAQDRGFITVYGPGPIPGEPSVRIDVDGRPVPPAGYGQTLQYPIGKRILHAEAVDPITGQVVLTRDQAVFVHPNRVTDVYVPGAETLPDTAMIGGGIAVTSFGVLSIVASGLLLTLADGAGTECFDADHWAADLCGYEPGPLVGWGVTTMLFGLAGIIGGPVMIAEGAELEPTWMVPEVDAGVGSLQLRWRF